jgi:hypothetical protein
MPARDHRRVDEPVIYREEVVALLFNVSDIAEALTPPAGDDDEEEDEG